MYGRFIKLRYFPISSAGFTEFVFILILLMCSGLPYSLI
jgi:hypothetical protein